ncbi:hypothetical protein EWM64_g266 [Hericium alpestre]|uniref:F-box domain-containing protein n=1 Tax=Hericium alpestre TaxID=135208 RepID=A0A4Z0ABK3_9AGAM|nr:hypothetical protein EWM64_g266 [Hericium alpestre]
MDASNFAYKVRFGKMNEKIPWVEVPEDPGPRWETPSKDWRNAHTSYFDLSSIEEVEEDFREVYGSLLDEADEPVIYKCSTIAVLPAELLVKIFSCLLTEDPPRIRETWDASGSHIVAAPYFGWLNITYVCHSWRRVAICSAALWTDLGHGLLLGPSWTKEFLLRARWASISIPSFEHYPKVIEMLSDWILAHLAHIRDLTLSGNWTHLRLPGHVIQKSFPELISADIDTGDEHSISTPDLFYSCVPKLRRLRLCNIKAWQLPGDFQGLEELEVHHYCAWCHAKRPGSIIPTMKNMLPSLVEMLDVLDELAPTLEHLRLHFSLPYCDPEAAPTTRKASLACLKSMALSAEVANLVQFLRHVDFPLSARLNLTCMPDELDGLRPICSLLADRFSHAEGESINITRVELGTGRYGDKVLICAYADHLAEHMHGDSLRLSRRAAEPILKLSLAYASGNDYIDMFMTFLRTVPLQDVYHLTIYGSWHVDAEEWHTVIRDSFIRLQNVRLLVLGQDAAQYFFHAIHDTTPSATRDAVAFPRLDTLILRNVDMSLFAHSATDRAPFEDQMFSVLQDRKDRRCPLRALVFISCQGIGEAWIVRLRELAVARAVMFGF